MLFSQGVVLGLGAWGLGAGAGRLSVIYDLRYSAGVDGTVIFAWHSRCVGISVRHLLERKYHVSLAIWTAFLGM